MDEAELQDFADFFVQSYSVRLEVIHGPEGAAAMLEATQFLQRLFKKHALEKLQGELVVFRALKRKARPLAGGTLVRMAVGDALSASSNFPMVIQVLDNDNAIVWEGRDLGDTEVTRISQNSVVYRWNETSEVFIARGQEVAVPRRPGMLSAFAAPTFSDLEALLEDYSKRFAKTSCCYILRQIWSTQHRVLLVEKPEGHMRDSLCQHLKSHLRGAEVRPEQNVDESHPVDIKVNWNVALRAALIEVKWLGRSVPVTPGKKGTSYTDGRARSGAKQLADYLEDNRQSEPSVATHGYLVVFDARRQHAVKTTGRISRAKGFYFEKREIKYTVKHHEVRDDFAPPIRFFLEPRC